MKKPWLAGAGACVLLAILAPPWGKAQPRPAAADAAVLRTGTVKDIDGNEYRTVFLGGREWMAGNLRTTRLNDGTPIAKVTEAMSWGDLLTPAYTWYNNNRAAGEPYGALYNWWAVGTGKLCPQGWRVPSDADWEVLVESLGGKTVAGGKLKSIAREGSGASEISDDQLEIEQPTYVPDQARPQGAPAPLEERSLPRWSNPNAGATNETGFTALPGGRRAYTNGMTVFENRGTYGYWWTSTESSLRVAWFRLLYYNTAHVSRMTVGKADGLSVCCVRD